MALPKELTTVTLLSKALAMIFFILFPFIGFYAGMQYQEIIDFQNQQVIAPETLKPHSAPSDNPTVWKTHKEVGYTFSYPADWIIKTNGYLGEYGGVILNNKQNSVSIIFSDVQYPYGFEGPGWNWKSQDLKIVVADKEYFVKEKILDNRVYVDFKPSVDSQTVYILFGTGYPASEDKNASITDYHNSRDTILEILSTFRFE